MRKTEAGLSGREWMGGRGGCDPSEPMRADLECDIRDGEESFSMRLQSSSICLAGIE